MTSSAIRLFFLGLMLAVGCAWRSGETEHYLGPMLFRFSDPSNQNANISQVRAFGLLTEIGSRWGLTIGYAERVAVIPRYMNESSGGNPIWSKPLSLFGPPTPDRWNMSLLYLRGTRVSIPRLVGRYVVGGQALIAREMNGVSIGVVSHLHVALPDNALVMISYNASDPLSTVFSVWTDDLDRELPIGAILEEVQQWRAIRDK
jgi:hypothetical protein